MARLFGALAVAGWLAAGSWQAGADEQTQTPDDSAAIFKQLDANNDGQLSEDEAPAARRQLFKRLLGRADANGDGRLSKAEFVTGMKDDRPEPPTESPVRAQAGVGAGAGPGAATAVLLRALDRDSDGTLSKDEVAAASASLLALDKDGDGALSRRELMAAPADEPRPVPKPNSAAAKLPDPQRLLARLHGMDANGDGKWSESELPPFLKRQFNKIDVNGDGAVDADELKQAIEVMRRRAEQRAAKSGK